MELLKNVTIKMLKIYISKSYLTFLPNFMFSCKRVSYVITDIFIAILN
jgi:hypothetical protein